MATVPHLRLVSQRTIHADQLPTRQYPLLAKIPLWAPEPPDPAPSRIHDDHVGLALVGHDILAARRSSREDYS